MKTTLTLVLTFLALLVFRQSAVAQQYTVSFRSVSGKYVVAEGGGGGRVNANRDAIGPWETFTLVDLNGGVLVDGDEVNIKSINGLFVVAEDGGGGVVNANRRAAGPWEKFIIRGIAGTGAISNGESIALRASNNQYVVAENGGGGIVNANRDAVGPWETFTLIIHR
jgi:hypothetical protein